MSDEKVEADGLSKSFGRRMVVAGGSHSWRTIPFKPTTLLRQLFCGRSFPLTNGGREATAIREQFAR